MNTLAQDIETLIKKHAEAMPNKGARLTDHMKSTYSEEYLELETLAISIKDEAERLTDLIKEGENITALSMELKELVRDIENKTRLEFRLQFAERLGRSILDIK